MSSKQILMGRIIGPHGLKGEVKIKSFTSDPLDVAAYGALLTPDGRKLTLVSPRLHGDTVIAAIKGVTDRSFAEALKGVKLSIDRENLPGVTEGEYYQADLVGLKVLDEEGRHWGEVAGFQEFGAGELMEIKRSTGKSALVPFADSMVPLVDVEQQRIVLSATGVQVLTLDDTPSKSEGHP